ncbi:MAG: hypothetical protein WDA04_07385, partial [Anaerolineaceae bacterium]
KALHNFQECYNIQHKHDGRTQVIRQRAATLLKDCQRPRSASDPTHLSLHPDLMERGRGDAL